DGSPRMPAAPLEQRHMDLAAWIQAVIEEAVLRLTRSLAAETGEANLCLAGGVALNCVANGKALRDGKFANIWVQPAGGDSGGALRAALTTYDVYADRPRTVANAPDDTVVSYLAARNATMAKRRRGSRRRGRATPRCRASGSSTARRRHSPTARPWAGSRGEWSLVRARSAIARSSPIRATRTCRRSSI